MAVMQLCPAWSPPAPTLHGFLFRLVFGRWLLVAWPGSVITLRFGVWLPRLWLRQAFLSGRPGWVVGQADVPCRFRSGGVQLVSHRCLCSA